MRTGKGFTPVGFIGSHMNITDETRRKIAAARKLAKIKSLPLETRKLARKLAREKLDRKYPPAK